MEQNFADLKKEAAATGEDLFNVGTAAAKESAAQLTHDLLGTGHDDDRADLGFEHVDPQAFVQRMSAGVKEAQEELDAKFAKAAESTHDDFNDFLGSASKNLSTGFQNFQQDVKKDLGSLTNDFMQAERGLMSYGDQAKEKVEAAKEKVEAAKNSAQELVDDLLGGALENGGSAPFAATAPAAKSPYDDDTFATSAKAPSSAAAADPIDDDFSDTETPSVSCNPSPAKKNPITDALKEQDNDKFISSEDLLSDFKETPSSAARLVAGIAADAVPTTDLDANSDDEAEFADVKKSALHSQVEDLVKPAAPAPAPAVPVATKFDAPAAKEPAAVTPAAVKEPAKPPVVKEQPKAQPQPAHQAQQPKIMPVEEIFYKYGLDAWFKPERLHPRVESLIYWRDVKKSGIVFGAGLLILLAVSCCSVISVFAYTSLFTLAATVAFRIYKSIMQAIQKTPEGHPFKEYLEFDLTMSQEKVQNIAGVAVAHVNGFTAELRRLFLVEDLVDSIKFGGILWVLTYIGGWFNGMTLVILAFVALFTLPKIYENNKQSIDTYLDLVRSKLTEITDKIKVAIPIGKKPVVAETEKDK